MSTGVECEGFICPYCLVGFSHQQQLQQHFLEMHSGLGIVEQDDYDVVEYVEDEVRLWGRHQVVVWQQVITYVVVGFL